MSTQPVRFSQLIERHQREIYRYVYRLTGNPSDAEDVLQEAFMRAFGAWSKLPRDANHRAWLYRIANRQALNLLRSRRRRRDAPLEQAADVSAGGPDAEQALVGVRLEQRLARALAELPPRQRAALLLRRYEALPYASVAEALGCSQQTARAHVHQAMKKIRAAIGAQPTRRR